MSIIISKNGKQAQKVEQSAFDRENYLQQYIYDNPDSIPLYDIKEDIRLLILAREFPTNSGPIDALGIDKDGEIYLVETKLYRNPDKRTVVAQVLDYGASLWRWSRDFNEFTRILSDASSKQFNLTLPEKLKEFFSISDEEITALLDSVAKNLNEGSFKFVVLMDKLDSRLKDLIVFVNANSKFDVFAVEIEYYKHNEYEIMIPRIFGSEVKKDIKVSSSGSARKRWDERTFFEALLQQCDPQYQDAVKQIYEFSKKLADDIRWGTGSISGSFNPIFENINSRSPYNVWTDGTLTLNFGWLNVDEKSEQFRDKLKLLVQDKLGFEVPDNYRDHFVSYTPEVWVSKAREFMEIVSSLVNA